MSVCVSVGSVCGCVHVLECMRVCVYASVYVHRFKLPHLTSHLPSSCLFRYTFFPVPPQSADAESERVSERAECEYAVCVCVLNYHLKWLSVS